MAAPSVLFFLLLGVTSSYCRTTTPRLVAVTTTPKACEYRGQFYKPGESFNPSPCEFCHCDFTGQAHCAIADCAPPQCVDAINKPDQCCPVCPNGPNCEAPDGSVIKVGETVTLANGATCACDGNQGFHWGAQQAVCKLPAPTVTYTKQPVVVN